MHSSVGATAFPVFSFSKRVGPLLECVCLGIAKPRRSRPTAVICHGGCECHAAFQKTTLLL